MLWRVDEHEALTETLWDEVLVRRAIDRIAADAEAAEAGGFWPLHPRDDDGDGDRFCSVYLGSAGMIWGLWKLGATFDAATASATALEQYRAMPDFGSDAHPPSLWMGETGLLLVAGMVGSSAADPDRLRELVHENRKHPTWELMWGSAGSMLAARECGLGDEWQESAALLWAAWDEATDLWTQHLYGNVQRILGPAHGFAGNVHALRGYVPDDVLRERVTRALTPTALRKDGLINWPPALGASESQIRVQWCHGAPGIVSTLGDLMPLELALGAGALIWRAGPLRKGSGLCHGTAGNGFAFLKLHDLTGDPSWLERARRFAMHAVEQVERDRSQFGRGRYTLWTGDIGVALYLQACSDAQSAFPTIDVF